VTRPMTRRTLAFASLAIGGLIATGASAQKSAAQQDWEAQQAAYLAANGKKPGWKTTASGVQYHLASKATKGAQPKADSQVKVKYVGHTVTDVEFDASDDTTMGVNEFVKGLREVVPMMHVGETWDFVVPAELGYGERTRPKIPVMSALIFKITLVAIEK
jgi:FKBP-type peptidyl-prolyl cis-trans isomerase FkpA